MSVPGWKRVRGHLPSPILQLTLSSDGNIRYFEYAQDKFEFLSEYKSADPQRGVAFLPKRGINTHENEVMRAFKTVNDSYIEPISFIVPRRAEVFQDDIYPPVFGSKPAMSSSEWFDGKESLPAKIDLGSVYAGGGPTEVPVDKKPAPKETTPALPPASVKEEAEGIKESPKAPPASRAPPPSMKDQSRTIANVASKFADKDDGDSDDDGIEDNSSFEVVSKPVDRSERKNPKGEEQSEGRGISKAPITAPVSSSASTTPLSRLSSETIATQTKARKLSLLMFMLKMLTHF